MRIASRTLTVCCVAGIVLGLCAAACAQSSLSDFNLKVSPPGNWTKYGGERPPHRFGGELLAAWERPTQAGKAIIYVLGTRREGQFMLDQVADSFEYFLRQNSIDAKLYKNFSVVDRPAVKFALNGKGTGEMIAGLSEDFAGDKATYMEVVLTTNMWADRSGTDFIQFVMGCPKNSGETISGIFRDVVHRATLTGTHDPSKAPANPEPAAATPAPDPEPEPAAIEAEPEPPVGAEPEPPVGAEPMTVAQAPPAPKPAPRPRRAAASSDAAPSGDGAMIGSLYRTVGGVPRPVTVQLLMGAVDGAQVSWQALDDEKTDVYVCIWSDMRATWIIPREDFLRLASSDGDGYVLQYQEALAPFLGNWQYLWSE